LRGVDGTAGKENFASGASLVGFSPVDIGDGERAIAVKMDAGGVGVRQHGEIWAVQNGVQEGIVGGVTAAVFLGDLVEAEAVLAGGIEVGIGGNSLLLRAGEERAGERVDIAQIGDVERTVSAVKFRSAAGLVFRLFEIRQDRREGPTGIPELFPIVKVARGAADVNHGVDGAGAAEDLAARPVKAAIVELRLGFGGIIPVHGSSKEFGEGGRDGDFASARRAAGFEE